MREGGDRKITFSLLSRHHVTSAAADEDGVFLLQICTCAEICSTNLNTLLAEFILPVDI